MAGPITLTANQRRQLDTYDPGRSPNPPGAGLSDILENLGRIRTGTVTVLSGATTAVVDVGAQFNGAPVLVSFGALPTALDLDVFGAVANGTLTVTLSADNTADIPINYLIDGRS